VTAAKAAQTGSTTGGQTFTLTTGVDNITGSGNNDAINAIVSTTAGESTLGVADVVNGGTGTDSLNVTLVGAAATLPAASITGVETINLRNVSSTAAQDISGITGVTKVASVNSLVNTSVTGLSAGTTVALQGSATNLTAQFKAGAFAAGSNAAVVVDAAGSKTAAGVVTSSVITLDNAGADGAATSVSIDANGANYITLSAGATNQIAGANGIKTLTITGAGSVELAAASALADGATTLAADLTKLDASANRGGVTASVANVDVVVTGGAGGDVITLANAGALTSKAGISLGEGNDKLLNNGSAGVGTTAVIDGGTGTDTIAATLLQVGNQANIKGFDILELQGETRTIDASLFTASLFQSVSLAGNLTGNTVVQKLAGTTLNADITGSSGAFDLTASLKDAATGTADVANIKFAATANATLQSFISSGNEAYNITSGGSTGVVNTITTLTDTLNTAAKITITGANALTIGAITTNTAQTTATADTVAALKEIDASAATGAVTVTAGASAAIGATAFNTTYTGLKITTGTGNDVVTSAARSAVISTGAGDDTVTVSGTGASVDTGAAATATGDTVNFNGANQSGVFGAGKQTAVLGANSAAGASLTQMTKITGATTGDVINFAAHLTTPAGLNTITDVTTSIGAAASLTAALNVAEGLGGETGAGDLVFFRWVDGNTYIVADKVGADAGATIAAADAVVQLVGSYTAMTAANGIVTLG
jgi:hypothetical protein